MIHQIEYIDMESKLSSVFWEKKANETAKTRDKNRTKTTSSQNGPGFQCEYAGCAKTFKTDTNRSRHQRDFHANTICL
jgi:hypothetical protein